MATRWRLLTARVRVQFYTCCTKRLHNSAHMISPPRLSLFSACNIENMGVARGQGYVISTWPTDAAFWLNVKKRAHGLLDSEGVCHPSMTWDGKYLARLISFLA